MIEDLRICKKNRYKTKEEAYKTAKRIEDVDPDTRLTAYKCHICHHWHLTSRLK